MDPAEESRRRTRRSRRSEANPTVETEESRRRTRRSRRSEANPTVETEESRRRTRRSRRTEANPTEGRPKVRWGLGDFFWIYFVGVIAGVLFASVGFGISGDPTGDPGALTTGLALGGQFGGWLVGLVWVSRHKGRGSLRDDFGFLVRLRDGWYLVGGIGLEIALGLMILPIVNLADQHQTVVEELEKAQGPELAVLAVFAGLVAPFAEELLFRGLLLRSLARRVPALWAVTLSAIVFAAAHPLFDPSLGSLAVVPALFALGAVSGLVALRTGELSKSILLHVGFNLLTTAAALFSR